MTSATSSMAQEEEEEDALPSRDMSPPAACTLTLALASTRARLFVLTNQSCGGVVVGLKGGNGNGGFVARVIMLLNLDRVGHGNARRVCAGTCEQQSKRTACRTSA